MTNESAILGMLAESYRDRAALQARCAELEAEIAVLREDLAYALDSGSE